MTKTAATSDQLQKRRPEDVPPNPRMWEALEKGPRLRAILEDFYDQVYRDERLAPFFVKTSKEWAIDHQFGFLAQAFSGEKYFFGDRPRNAHHWMVISDELFDYREELMAATLRRHSIPEDLIEQWRMFEEKFRSHIVKDVPFPKKRRGKPVPLEGIEMMELSAGSICDKCEAELAIGTQAFCDLRSAKLYCAQCKPDPVHTSE